MADEPNRSAGGVTGATSSALASMPGFEPGNVHTWKPLLTEELRGLFESKGTTTVQAEVLSRVYRDDGKHFAAQYWLWETRRHDRIEKVVYGVVMLVVGVLAILVAV